MVPRELEPGGYVPLCALNLTPSRVASGPARRAIARHYVKGHPGRLDR